MRLLWLLIAFLHTSPATPPTGGMHSGKVDPAIVAAADDYLQANLRGDAAAVASFFTDDAVEMPPGRAALEGRSAIESYTRELCAGPLKLREFSFLHRETRALAETGIDVGTYRQKLASPDGGTVEDAGNYIALLRREDGRWRVSHLIFNSTRPAPAGPASPAR
jgi:uncharacterized protein (TIGR02246 family)